MQVPRPEFTTHPLVLNDPSQVVALLESTPPLHVERRQIVYRSKAGRASPLRRTTMGIVIECMEDSGNCESRVERQTDIRSDERVGQPL
jgi:hypothetical protein